MFKLLVLLFVIKLYARNDILMEFKSWNTDVSFLSCVNLVEINNFPKRHNMKPHESGAVKRQRITYLQYNVQNCSFFMSIIFCSSVAVVWTFNTRGVYNFITKEVNIPVNLVLFFNDVSFLFCCFLKSGVTNELKSLFLWKSKKVRVIYSKQGKTLLLIKR